MKTLTITARGAIRIGLVFRLLGFTGTRCLRSARLS